MAARVKSLNDVVSVIDVEPIGFEETDPLIPSEPSQIPPPPNHPPPPLPNPILRLLRFLHQCLHNILCQALFFVRQKRAFFLALSSALITLALCVEVFLEISSEAGFASAPIMKNGAAYWPMTGNCENPRHNEPCYNSLCASYCGTTTHGTLTHNSKHIAGSRLRWPL